MEVMALLLAWRISQAARRTSGGVNDYGFELLSDQPTTGETMPLKCPGIFSLDKTLNIDLQNSVTATEMATP